eukprot:COSAG02_NODE_322_length_24779_cov_14.118233_9_plen_86_part_00
MRIGRDPIRTLERSESVSALLLGLRPTFCVCSGAWGPIQSLAEERSHSPLQRQSGINTVAPQKSDSARTSDLIDHEQSESSSVQS